MYPKTELVDSIRTISRVAQIKHSLLRVCASYECPCQPRSHKAVMDLELQTNSKLLPDRLALPMLTYSK